MLAKNHRKTARPRAALNEFTRPRMLNPATVPADIRADEVSLVGRYAIDIRWSDRHATGIYTF